MMTYYLLKTFTRSGFLSVMAKAKKINIHMSVWMESLQKWCSLLFQMFIGLIKDEKLAGIFIHTKMKTLPLNIFSVMTSISSKIGMAELLRLESWSTMRITIILPNDRLWVVHVMLHRQKTLFCWQKKFYLKAALP